VFSLFASETSAIGFADDHIDVAWFPPSVSIIEQGEAADTLYLVLSGEVDVTQDRADGTKSFIRREGPGAFFGEVGIARRVARTANVSSVTAVTCLVFSPGHREAWAARGPADTDPSTVEVSVGSEQPAGLLTVVDVRPVLDRKIAALAAHRTQHPIDPEMFPNWLLAEMMGHEWFVRVQPPPHVATDLFA
jgi:CRP-like cAMP-binding protein